MLTQSLTDLLYPWFTGHACKKWCGSNTEILLWAHLLCPTVWLAVHVSNAVEMMVEHTERRHTDSVTGWNFVFLLAAHVGQKCDAETWGGALRDDIVTWWLALFVCVSVGRPCPSKNLWRCRVELRATTSWLSGWLLLHYGWPAMRVRNYGDIGFSAEWQIVPQWPTPLQCYGWVATITIGMWSNLCQK